MRTAGYSFDAIRAATSAKRERVQWIVDDWLRHLLTRSCGSGRSSQIDEVVKGLYPRAVAGEPQAVLALNRDGSAHQSARAESS